MLFSLLYRNYTLNAFNECLSYNGGESTYNDTERFPTCSPLVFKREHLLGECSLTFAPFNKEKHILKVEDRLSLACISFQYSLKTPITLRASTDVDALFSRIKVDKHILLVTH